MTQEPQQKKNAVRLSKSFFTLSVQPQTAGMGKEDPMYALTLHLADQPDGPAQAFFFSETEVAHSSE